MEGRALESNHLGVICIPQYLDLNECTVPPENRGLKKTPSSHPGQVDFLTTQELFHSHLPDRQGLHRAIKSLAWAKSEKSNLRFAHGKQNLRSTWNKDKLEFNFF